MMQTQLVRLTADAPLAFLVFGMVACIYLAQRDERPRLFYVAGIFGLGVILTKNEGLVLWLMVLTSALASPARAWFRQRSDLAELRRRALSLGVLPLLGALPWLVLRSTLPKLNIDYAARIGDSSLVLAFERLPSIVANWTLYLGAWRDWLGVWPLAAIVVGLTVRERHRTGLGFLLASVALPLVVYTGVYMFTPLELAGHMDVSASRLGLHVFPVLRALALALERSARPQERACALAPTQFRSVGPDGSGAQGSPALTLPLTAKNAIRYSMPW